VFAQELALLEAAGLLYVDNERVRLTPHGLLMGNQVFMQFLPES
jgi:coproporphyrinogen III oxidase-like Fe-S oxidoreductase